MINQNDLEKALGKHLTAGEFLKISGYIETLEFNLNNVRKLRQMLKYTDFFKDKNQLLEDLKFEEKNKVIAFLNLLSNMLDEDFTDIVIMIKASNGSIFEDKNTSYLQFLKRICV
jgi:hypothetical protein